MQNAVNERIKILVKALGITPSKFATTVGVSAATISRLIDNKNTPSQTVIEKILSKYPSVKEEWLINGTGEMTENGELISSSQTKTPWRDEAYNQMKLQNEKLNAQVERLTLMLSKVMGVDLGKFKPLELLADSGVIIPLSVSGVDAA